MLLHFLPIQLAHKIASSTKIKLLSYTEKSNKNIIIL